MRIIIAGSRGFDNYAKLEKDCTYVLSMVNPSNSYKVTVVCGEADGADKLGKKFGTEHGFDIKSMPADWYNLKAEPCRIRTNTRGRRYNMLAGHNRNRDMAEFAAEDMGVLIAFWDGESTGTKGMIDLAYEYGLRVFIFKYKEVVELFNTRVYADGASSNNQDKDKRVGGTGIVLVCDTAGGKHFYKELSNRYPGMPNNRAELMAILEGLQAIKKDHRKSTAIEVISDSRNAILTFNEWIDDWKPRGWKKKDKSIPSNLDVIKQIDSIRTEFSRITFRHVPSCKGDNSTEDKKYNNRADELASIAAGSRGH